MASQNYAAWSVVAGEQPTTAKWNILGTNDGSFNSGLGFNDGIINARHLNGTGLSAAITTYTNTGTGGGTVSYINLGGIKLMWGIGMVSSSTAWLTINWAVVGYTSTPIVTANSISQGSASGGWVEFTSLSAPGSGSPNATGCSFLNRVSSSANSNATTIDFFGIGK
jgi:hypothetical protein